MAIEFDEKKRADTLGHRGLDFARAEEVFAGLNLTIEYVRKDYGEARYQTLGLLDDTVVMVVWTPRGQNRRVISMRKGNEHETRRYGLGGP